MKTIIYLRTSTEEQNPENQLSDCQKINSYGEAEVIEEKQSAWKDNKERPKFEALKKRIVAGEVSHLIVWDFDRLFRNRIKFKEFLLLLKAYKVQLHSARQQWLESINQVPSPWNEIVYDMLINVFGWMAEEESKKKSERVKIAFVNHKGSKWGRPSIPQSAIDGIIAAHQKGKSMRQIAKQVTYWDSSRNEQTISLGLVHKIITNFNKENNRKESIQQ